MASRSLAFGTAKQPHQPIARFHAANRGARLIASAAPVDLSGSNAGNPDPRPLSTPDRTVTIPDSNRRAGEDRASRNNLCKTNAQDHFSSVKHQTRLV